MRVFAAAALLALAGAAPAPVPTPGDFVVHNFKFADGETLPELRLHYLTLGTPHRDAKGQIDNAVMVLHGTGGSGAQFLRPQFTSLYGEGAPLDLAKTYVILPDGIGHGASSKPSDGLRMKFPKYDYTDMVAAQHALLVDGLKVTRLRLIMGTSMGCMHAFVWGEAYPGFARALMPLACLPVEIAGRNRMWRKLSIDAIMSDPKWAGGGYTEQPLTGMTGAAALTMIAGSAPVAQQRDFPTRASVDAMVPGRIAADLKTRDANDWIYQLDASRTYNPAPALAKITVPVAWINSADDFINPPGLGIAPEMVRQMPNATFRLIPEGPDGHGHGTHTWASFWTDDLKALLARSE
jgi:homoserine O-acetyltransferase/O-succinyltransferase